MTKWQLQEAKARFSELIDDTLEKGPQVVTRWGNRYRGCRFHRRMAQVKIRKAFDLEGCTFG
jgi:hypothetical protein